ncbi:hypothetical protein [Mangrovibacterium marinum]|uniref:hypothetical protein n=1 Tax=Mangrovibacterium marinum TaxID=1639118 RepID=UPI002A18E8AA|nr:hypothetical protein [Mangrovibacterium marinum]
MSNEELCPTGRVFIFVGTQKRNKKVEAYFYHQVSASESKVQPGDLLLWSELPGFTKLSVRRSPSIKSRPKWLRAFLSVSSEAVSIRSPFIPLMDFVTGKKVFSEGGFADAARLVFQLWLLIHEELCPTGRVFIFVGTQKRNKKVEAYFYHQVSASESKVQPGDLLLWSELPGFTKLSVRRSPSIKSRPKWLRAFLSVSSKAVSFRSPFIPLVDFVTGKKVFSEGAFSDASLLVF